MAGKIPENILEDILNRIDIVEVISGYLPLKKSGRNFKACCPFHHEKTPSFMVSSEKQIYHCFGCGESGNAFKFLMRYERFDFPEAVQTLAKKAGVILPETHRLDQASTNLSTLLFKANELATLFYENNLQSTQGTLAKNYLLKRGISNETIKLFKLGFALESWDSLINHLRQKSVSLLHLDKAGLVVPKDGGGFYDRFRNRIIFPIFDVKARSLAFGARVLDNSLPKYINSPETAVYVKGKNLYGLNLAKEAIRENDYVVIVEGYLDLIIPFQYGIKNIVASLGTALTADQARLIKRHTQNVVMVYDADQAGEMAALRSLDIFVEEEMNVKVASLPQGFDPDTFVRKYGAEQFKGLIESAENLFDYKLKILKSRFDARQIEGKAKICASMLETLSNIKNEILKSEYIRKLAQSLDVEEDALIKEIRKVKQEPNRADLRVIAPPKGVKINPAEQLLIKLMLDENRLVGRIKENLEPADFQDERASRIVSIIFDLDSQGKTIGAQHLMNYLEDEDILQIVSESVFLLEDASKEHKEKVVHDCINRLKNEKTRLRRVHLHDQIKDAQAEGDEKRINELVEEFHDLIKKR